MISLVNKTRRGRAFYLKLTVTPKRKHVAKNLRVRIYRAETGPSEILFDPPWGVSNIEEDLLAGEEYTISLKLENVPIEIKRAEFGLVEEGVTWHYRDWVEL